MLLDEDGFKGQNLAAYVLQLSLKKEGEVESVALKLGKFGQPFWQPVAYLHVDIVSQVADNFLHMHSDALWVQRRLEIRA